LNCATPPIGIVSDPVEATTIDLSAVGTVTEVCPLTPLLSVAIMFALPAATAVANPEAETVAADVLSEVQVEVAVRSLVLESLYVPVALNCCVPPMAIVGVAGVTAIECSVGAGTVIVAWPCTPPLDVAMMFALPAATAVASPEAETIAVDVLSEVHVTVAVRSLVLESLYVPVALNCCVPPMATVGADGVTAIDSSVGAGTVIVAWP
jgi:hypothetical protein